MIRITILSFVLFIIVSGSLYADKINIPADYPTIQEGIDAAVNGDVLMVAPGTYEENIDFIGKAITVTSSGGACVTVIDADNYGSVVTFASGEGRDSLLEGFTITNGRGTYIYPDILLGGGIYCDLSSPTISCNTITANVIPGIIGYGGGIYSRSGSPLIINNTIADNSSAFDGGGLYYYGGSPETINNTITRNTAVYGRGGGLFCRSCTCDISNTILWNNTAVTGPEIALTFPGGPSVLTINHSDVEGGQGSAQVDSGCTLFWGAGMIDAVPAFVDVAGDDYHLTYNSPCRDSGNNSVVTELYDFEGDPRIAWAGTVDMGADEFYTHMYILGDQTPGGIIYGKLIGPPGTTPVAVFIGSGVRETPLPTQYGDFYLLPPRILIPLVPIPANGVLAVPTTIPLSPPAPYDIPMQGLIGLDSDSLTNVCVLEVRDS